MSVHRDKTRFYLATLTYKRPIDVIAIHNNLVHDAFITYCEGTGTSYIRTNEDDAAKLLCEQDGVGFGCFTMHGASDDCYDTRRQLALERKIELANKVGVALICEPDELVSSVAIQETDYTDEVERAIA